MPNCESDDLELVEKDQDDRRHIRRRERRHSARASPGASLVPDLDGPGEWDAGLFRSDCENWLAHQPCPIQRSNGLANCRECGHFGASRLAVGPANDVREFVPGLITAARSIGILEAGGLGSILRTTAVSRAVRRLNPQARLSWFSHARGLELLRLVPGVAGVPLEDPELTTRTRRRLDVMLNFETAGDHAHVVAGRGVVGGFRLNRFGRFEPAPPFAGELARMQIDDRFRAENTRSIPRILLDSVGLTEEPAEYDIMLSDQMLAEATAYLTAVLPGVDRVVGLNPGTSAKGALRRWPARSFAALLERAAAAYPSVGFLVLRGPDDHDVVDHLGALVPATRNVAVMSDAFDVGVFVALTRHLAALVTSDTFALHAALSQRTPVVALAGPMPVAELGIATPDVVLGPELSCAPCYHRCSHSSRGACMQRIAVRDVERALREVLG